MKRLLLLLLLGCGSEPPRAAAITATPTCAQPTGSVWLADQCPQGNCRTNCRYYDHAGVLLAVAAPPCVETGTADPRYPELCVADCSLCSPP